MEQVRRIIDVIEKFLPENGYSGNRDVYKKEVEENVNNFIKEYRDKITVKVDEIGQDKFYEYCHNYIVNNENIYRKLQYNRYNFLIKNNGYYVFDLSYVYKNCYLPEFEDGVKDVLIDFFLNEIAHAIIVMEYIDSKASVYVKVEKTALEKIISNTKIRFLEKIHMYLFIIIVTGVLLYNKFFSFYVVVTSEIEQTVSLSLLGAVISFLGFGVVFFQLSYDNLKKTYSYYSKQLIFKSISNGVTIIFFTSIISGFLTAVLSYKESVLGEYWQDIFFNINVIYFFYFGVFLFYKLKDVINFSLSSKEIGKLIDSITVDTVIDFINSNRIEQNNVRVIDFYSTNSIEIISDITYNLLLQNNFRQSEIIIKDLTKHYIKIIEEIQDNNSSDVLENILYTYSAYIKLIVNGALRNNFDRVIETCYDCIYSLNYYSLIKNYNAICINEIFSLLKSMIDDSGRYNKNKQLKEGIDCYYRCAVYQFINNTPYKFEIPVFFEMYTSKNSEIYAQKNEIWKALNRNAVHKFYLITRDSIDDVKNMNSISLLSISTAWGIYVNEIVDSMSIGLTQKHSLLKNVFDYTLSLYFILLKKEEILEGYRLTCPVKLNDVYRYIGTSDDIASLVHKKYITWSKFLIDNNIGLYSYIEEAVTEILYLIRYLLYHLEDESIQNYLINKYAIESLEVISLITYDMRFLSSIFMYEFQGRLRYLITIISESTVKLPTDKFNDELLNILEKLDRSNPEHVDENGNYIVDESRPIYESQF